MAMPILRRCHRIVDKAPGARHTNTSHACQPHVTRAANTLHTRTWTLSSHHTTPGGLHGLVNFWRTSPPGEALPKFFRGSRNIEHLTCARVARVLHAAYLGRATSVFVGVFYHGRRGLRLCVGLFYLFGRAVFLSHSYRPSSPKDECNRIHTRY